MCVCAPKKGTNHISFYIGQYVCHFLLDILYIYISVQQAYFKFCFMKCDDRFEKTIDLMHDLHMKATTQQR